MYSILLSLNACVHVLSCFSCVYMYIFSIIMHNYNLLVHVFLYVQILSQERTEQQRRYNIVNLIEKFNCISNFQWNDAIHAKMAVALLLVTLANE